VDESLLAPRGPDLRIVIEPFTQHFTQHFERATERRQGLFLTARLVMPD